MSVHAFPFIDISIPCVFMTFNRNSCNVTWMHFSSFFLLPFSSYLFATILSLMYWFHACTGQAELMSLERQWQHHQLHLISENNHDTHQFWLNAQVHCLCDTRVKLRIYFQWYHSPNTFPSYVNKYTRHGLTHWGRVTHICVGNLSIIDSDNGLSPSRHQAIIRTNAGIFAIWTVRNKLQWNFNRNSNIFIQEITFENIVYFV